MITEWIIGTAYAAGAAHDGHGGGTSGSFPPFDGATFGPQLFWLAVMFGLLYYLMSRVALPRVGKILEDRANTISKDLDAAASMQKKAQDASASYDQALAKAKANAQAIADAARQKAAQESDAKRKQIEADLAAKLAAAEATIADTKAKAMTSVEGIASDAASAIIQRFVGNMPDGKELAAALTSAMSRP
jgi:F-type H+-transporting ATPase subunit b